MTEPAAQHVAKVLTASDGVSAGEREDTAGPAVAEALTQRGFRVVDTVACPDGRAEVRSALERLTDDFHGLVVVTGGTGFGPRDETPEAVQDVVEKVAPGFGEAMRSASGTLHGLLSRAVCGSAGRALVVAVPGSPKGAVECLAAVVEVVPHALDLLGGGSPH